MTDRRSLTATLSTLPNIDPDAARAFVTQETTPSNERRLRVRTHPDHSPTATAEPTRKPIRRSRASGIAPVGLIPVTVRLQPAIAGALKRASLERELAGEEPFTQQELVEQLLEPWLRQHGYLA